MEGLQKILESISSFIWGVPLIVLIMGAGIFFSISLKLIQIRKFGLATRLIFKESKGPGDLSAFESLCVMLAAAIGTGNVVGVAIAITAGGPGAVVWMAIAAFVGMATVYVESTLGVKYRVKDKNGEMLGGPFYYIEKGMGKNWKWMAKLFAIFALLAACLGIGSMSQVNSIAAASERLFSASASFNFFGNDVTYVAAITGLICAILAGFVLIGGIKKIAKVSTMLVPFMAALFLIATLLVIFLNIDKLPAAISLIFREAFSAKAITGGAIGGGIMLAMRYGIARGIFSNEAGLGSAPIAAAAAKTDNDYEMGLVNMVGVFVDTLLICVLTGIAIVVTGSYTAYQQGVVEGIEISSMAYEQGIYFAPVIGKIIVNVGLMLFAFSTILGWYYYGERCSAYAFGEKSVKIYRYIYILTILLGTLLTLDIVWVMADILNGLMILPNVIALFVLFNVVRKESDPLMSRQKMMSKNINK